MMDGDKTVIRPRLKDLAEGDVHLANLSAYAKLLVSGEDPDKAAHNAGLLYLTIIDAFQQTGITNVQWSPNLILEIGSREYEVSASCNIIIIQTDTTLHRPTVTWHAHCMFSLQIDIHDQHRSEGNSSVMVAPVLVSVDTPHFTQSGLERSVTGPPGLSGTSSPPPVANHLRSLLSIPCKQAIRHIDEFCCPA